MAQDTAEKKILEKLAQTQTFHPSGAKLFVPDWTLDPGDVITVQSDGTDYAVPIYSMDLTWNGVSTAEVQSTGNQEREPLSELKRKEYQSGRRGYAAQRELEELEEQQIQQYQHFVEENDVYRESVYAIVGVRTNADGDVIWQQATDEQGNLIWETDEQGNLILDDNGNPIPVPARDAAGNKIPVFDPSATGSLSGKVTETAQNYSILYEKTGVNSLLNEETLYSRLEQNTGEITTIVGLTGIVNAKFDEDGHYAIGDKVLYNGVAYVFTASHHGPWTGTDVGVVGSLQSQITQTVSTITHTIEDTANGLSTRIDQTVSSITSVVSTVSGLSTQIQQTASDISLIVTSGSVSREAIVAAINAGTGSTRVAIDADQIDLTGYVTASQLFVDGTVAAQNTIYAGDLHIYEDAQIDGDLSLSGTSLITTGAIDVAGTVDADTLSAFTVETGSLFLDGVQMEAHSVIIAGTAQDVFLAGTASLRIPDAIASFGPATSSGGSIRIPYTTVGGTSSAINFNIADTQYYQDGVSAARNSIEVAGYTWDVQSSDSQTAAHGKIYSVRLQDVTLGYQTGVDQQGDPVYTTTRTYNQIGPQYITDVYNQGWTDGSNDATGSQGGIESVRLTRSTESRAEFIAYDPPNDASQTMTRRFGQVRVIAKNGDEYYLGIDAQTVYINGFNYCKNSIGMSSTGGEIAPGSSETVYPMAYANYTKTTATNITSLGVTYSAPEATSIERITLTSSEIGTVRRTGLTAYYNDQAGSETYNVTAEIDASAVYTAGQTNGQQSVVPTISAAGWQWTASGNDTILQNIVTATNPNDSTKKNSTPVTLDGLTFGIDVTNTGVTVTASDGVTSGVIATGSHTKYADGQNSVKLVKSQSGGVTTISKVTDGTGTDTATVTVTPGTVSVTPGTWNSTSKLLPIGGTGTVDVDGTTLNLTAGSASVSVTPGSVSVTHTWDSTNHQYTVSGTGSVDIGGTTGNLTAYDTPLVPTDAINYGKTLVEQRSVTGLSDTITLASTDTGTSDHTAYVEYDDDTDDSISVRINASAVYTAGQNSVTVNAPTCGEATPAVASTAVRTSINIKAVASNNASSSKDFTLQKSTYTPVSTAYNCVNLLEGSTVIGRINTQDVYAAGFGVCHDSIGLSQTTQTISAGESITIYPTAKASVSASEASNITSAGITITAASGGGTRTVRSLSGIVLGSTDIGVVTKTTTPIYSDGLTDTTARNIEIDASAVYTAGFDAGYGGTVNVVKGNWSSGQCTFSPSAGSGASQTVIITPEAVGNSSSATGTLRIYDKTDSTNPILISSHQLQLQKILGYVNLAWNNGASYQIMARVAVDSTAVDRYVSSLGSITLTSADIGTSTKYPLITYTDASTDQTKGVTIDASAVYSAGLAAGSGLSIEANRNYGEVTANNTYVIEPSSGYGVMANATITVNVDQTVSSAIINREDDSIGSSWSRTLGTGTLTKKYGQIRIAGPAQNEYYIIDASEVYTRGLADGADTAGYQLTTVELAGSPNYFRSISVPTGTTSVNAVSGSGALYQVNSNGTLYVDSVEVSRVYYGYLYKNEGSSFERVPNTGNGSWFYVEGNVASVMRKSAIKVARAETTAYTVATGTRTAYVLDSSGTIEWYTKGRTVSDTYYIQTT